MAEIIFYYFVKYELQHETILDIYKSILNLVTCLTFLHIFYKLHINGWFIYLIK